MPTTRRSVSCLWLHPKVSEDEPLAIPLFFTSDPWQGGLTFLYGGTGPPQRFPLHGRVRSLGVEPSSTCLSDKRPQPASFLRRVRPVGFEPTPARLRVWSATSYARDGFSPAPWIRTKPCGFKRPPPYRSGPRGIESLDGFEPPFRGLQPLALPLGHRLVGVSDGNRTRAGRVHNPTEPPAAPPTPRLEDLDSNQDSEIQSLTSCR